MTGKALEAVRKWAFLGLIAFAVTALAGINIAFLKENRDRRFTRARGGIGDLLETLRAKPHGTSPFGPSTAPGERRRGASRW